MNIDRAKTLGRLAGLLVVTLFAGAVMWATGVRRIDTAIVPSGATELESAIAPAAPVAVRSLVAEQVEVIDTYAGMIQPFERFRLAFEVAGRVATLGQGSRGLDLDEGDAVSQGQVLATLDQRILTARVNEASALLEQAQQELQRARQMRRARNPAISETDYQNRVTNLAVAEAQVVTTQKDLEDAQLRSPCDGVISRRYINPGESTAAHQAAFEIVQVDRVLLVVGVPESRVQELEVRKQHLIDAREDGDRPLPFRVHISLMGRDRFGKPRPNLEGKIYRIGETADDKTGLFDVEIVINNDNNKLKAGLVAQARIVVDELSAYRIPIDAVLFRDATPFFYAVHEQPTDLRAMFWNLGPQPDYFVRQVSLNRYIEQAGQLIVPEIDDGDRTLVVRGQRRLVEGRRVRIVSSSETPHSTAFNAGPADSPTAD